MLLLNYIQENYAKFKNSDGKNDFFVVWRGLNLGPCTRQAGTLSLSYSPNLQNDFKILLTK